MDDAGVLPARHKLDVETYDRMTEAGVFAGTERIELIEGDLIDMAPIGQGHEAVVAGLMEALFIACAGRATVWPQSSVRLGQWSAPQPDLAILRRRADFYATGERPGPADVLLLVGVADNSLRFDRTVKLPLYARAGIAEFWLIDMKRRAIDVYREPQGDTYATMTTHQAGEQIALERAPEIVVQLSIVFAWPDMNDPTGLAHVLNCGYAAEGAALGLLGLMTGISQELICAGWVHELEYTLWKADGGTHIGISTITERQAKLLMLLSEEAQGWWMWSDALGRPEFVNLETWAIHIGKRTKITPQAIVRLLPASP